MLWYVNDKCASFWRRKKKEEKKEGERGSRRGGGKRMLEEEGVTSVKTNVGRWPGLCRLQKNVPTSARRL